MYLLVIITLLIGIIAVYAQVVSLQTARMFSHQSGVAQAMLTWHAGAVSMAANIMKNNTADFNAQMAAAPKACSLTWNSLPAPIAIPRCASPENPPNTVGSYIDPQAAPIRFGGAVTDGGNPISSNLIYNNADGVNEAVHLPATYDTKNHQFYSILFQAGGQTYVATIVPAPVISASNPAPGYISLATSGTGATAVTPQLALTAADLVQQLKRTIAPSYSYGFVNAAYQLNTSVWNMTLPAFNNPNGAVALIGSPNGF